MKPVLVVGDIVTDIVAIHSGPIAVGSDTEAAISVTGGGSAANTAAWLAWLGSSVELVAVVGQDPAGDARVTELEAAGVGCRFVSRTAGAATGCIVVLAGAGQRSFLRDRGANLLLRPSHVDTALAGVHAGHLHLSGYVLLDEASRPAGRHALHAARAAGLSTSVDAASAAPLRREPEFLDWIAGVGILLANLDEARVLAGPGEPEELGRRLLGPAGRVAIKLGGEGAVWVGPDGVLVTAAEPTTLVDATGAGDAFAAGLLHTLLSGAPPVAAVREATRLGAIAVATAGGRPVSAARRPAARPDTRR